MNKRAMSFCKAVSLFATVAVLGALVGLPPLPLPVVEAASITVAAGEVAISDNGRCSLLEAIINANNDAQIHDDCAAGNGVDTIMLALGTTYALTDVADMTEGPTGLPSITSEITIRGNGATIKLDPNLTCVPNGITGTTSPNLEFRIIRVASTGNLTLNTVTISNGCADGIIGRRSFGGGILNNGTVNITNSTLSDNYAKLGGGILNNAGTVTIMSSTFSDNVVGVNDCGGGIYNNAGTVTIMSSTLSGNEAGDGGGIGNSNGWVSITNSTLSDNESFLFGGGIWNNATVHITNSTLSGNQANVWYGGGIHNEGGTVTIMSSTLWGNSGGFRGGAGGIYNEFGGTVRAKNSIMANTGGNCVGGTFTPSGMNFATDATCSGFTVVTEAQLNFGPLQVNPPGTTATHALLSGSVAIDAATDCTLLDGTTPVIVDQRGVSRPQGPECDVGAYEAIQFTFTIAGAGTGSGTVTGTMGGNQAITCMISAGATSDDCDESALPGNNPMVVLTALPDMNSTFVGWSGPSDCLDGVVTINASKVCTARFDLKPGMIIINKTAVGENATFNFTASNGLSNFSITTTDGTGSQTFTNVTPGSKTVTEAALPAHWVLSDLVCTDPDGGTTVNLSARRATIDLDPGETVTCTFTNTFQPPATLVINKTAIGGNGTFSFSGPNGGSFSLTTSGGTATRSFTLASGTYTVSETTPPSGWSFGNLVCNDPTNNTSVTLSQRKAAINLAAGETVTCTFVNTKLSAGAFTLQGNGHCLALDLDMAQYRFKTASHGTFTGPLRFTRTATQLRFLNGLEYHKRLSGVIYLTQGGGRGNALLLLPRSLGGPRFSINDPNIADNGPCTP